MFFLHANAFLIMLINVKTSSACVEASNRSWFSLFCLYEVCGTLLSVRYRLVAQREKFINKFFIGLFILKNGFSFGTSHGYHLWG